MDQLIPGEHHDRATVSRVVGWPQESGMENAAGSTRWTTDARDWDPE